MSGEWWASFFFGPSAVSAGGRETAACTPPPKVRATPCMPLAFPSRSHIHFQLLVDRGKKQNRAMIECFRRANSLASHSSRHLIIFCITATRTPPLLHLPSSHLPFAPSHFQAILPTRFRPSGHLHLRSSLTLTRTHTSAFTSCDLARPSNCDNSVSTALHRWLQHCQFIKTNLDLFVFSIHRDQTPASSLRDRRALNRTSPPSVLSYIRRSQPFPRLRAPARKRTLCPAGSVQRPKPARRCFCRVHEFFGLPCSCWCFVFGLVLLPSSHWRTTRPPINLKYCRWPICLPAQPRLSRGGEAQTNNETQTPRLPAA